MSGAGRRTQAEDDAFLRKLGDRLRRQPNMALVLITVAEGGAGQVVSLAAGRQDKLDALEALTVVVQDMLLEEMS